jgi:hypothetical protein
MAFAHLTYRKSLRDIEVYLRAQAKRLHHMGLHCKTVSRNTLAIELDATARLMHPKT